MTSISDTNVVNAPGGLVELGYSERTSSYTLPSASSSYTVPFCPEITVVSDGSPLLIEFQSPASSVASGGSIYINLVIDGSITGIIYQSIDSTSQQNVGIRASRRVVLSAGSHTIAVSAWGSGSPSPSIQAGNGGIGSFHPMFLRVNKIIQASQLIVQTPNAPLVTSLPSNAIDGQEVRYLADNTNGIIWNFRYRAGSPSNYKWEFIGGGSLFGQSTGAYTPSGATWQNSGLISMSIPFAGDYKINFGWSYVETGATTATVGASPNATGLTAPNGTTGAANSSGVFFTTAGGGGYSRPSLASTYIAQGVSGTLTMYVYNSNGSGVVFYRPHMILTPIRVSA